MTQRRRPPGLGLLAATIACASLTAACGLKGDVSARPIAQGDGAAQQPASPASAVVPAADETTSPSADAAGTAASSSSAPVTAASQAPAPAVGSTSASPPPGNTTGLDPTAKTIRVFLHAPGAASPASFLSGARKYWEQSGPGGGPRRVLGGYRILVDAAAATTSSNDACEKGARSSFLLVGGAATDEVQSCATSAGVRVGKVPYLSFGGTETGLAGLPTYFANSLTHRQQSPLVVRMARDNGFLTKKWAVVTPDTATYADARASIVRELVAAGVAGRTGGFDADRDVYLTERAPNNCVELGNELRSGGYGAVYFLGQQPLFFGQCVNAYPSAVYTGPGPTYATQSFADLACRGGSNAFRGYFLHPSPDLAMSQGLAKGAPAFADDVEAGAWGAMQALEQAFALVGGSLTREAFTAALASGRTAGGVLTPAAYNGRSHLGGTGAYADKLSCNGGRASVTTIATYTR